MKKINFLVSLLLFVIDATVAQEHNFNNGYIKPADTLVQQKIESWQDLKFGLFIHWGTYSQWGVVESWSATCSTTSHEGRDY